MRVRFNAAWVLAVSLALGAWAQPAGAQALEGLRSGGAPLEIESDQGIEWHRKTKQYIARGNARAARGDLEIFADLLTAHYRQSAAGKSEIYRIDADGSVRMVSPGESAYADKAVYQVDKGLLLLTGDDLRLQTAEDLVRARDSLEYWEHKQIAVARGEASATRADREITADILTAYFKPDAEDRLQLNTVRADGNVRIVTPSEFARGDGGVYYVKQQIATLSGAVKITRGDSQLNGEYAEVNLESGVSRLLGAPPGQPGDARVRGLLVPEGEKTGEDNGAETAPGTPQ